MTVLKENHHVVPQFYLQRFAKDGLLREHRRGLGVRRQNTADATVIKFLYTVDTPDGETNQLEDFYGVAEGWAGRAFKKIDSGVWPLDNDSRNDLAHWMALQYLRTPKARRTLEAGAQDFRRQLGRLVAYEDIHAALGWPELPREEVMRRWRSMLDRYPASGPVPRNRHVAWVRWLRRDVARDMFERDWFLVRYDAPRYLLSDNPIVPLLPNNAPASVTEYFQSTKVGLPLDRSTGLLLVRRDGRARGDNLAPQTDEHVAAFNRLSVAHADMSVFEHPDDAFFPGWNARPGTLARIQRSSAV